jgi:hypothetical protein
LYFFAFLLGLGVGFDQSNQGQFIKKVEEVAKTPWDQEKSCAQWPASK